MCGCDACFSMVCVYIKLAMVYFAGKDDSMDSELGMSSAVVLKLVDPICGYGYLIYMDNLYTSLQLFTELRLQGFGSCSTLRLSRRGLPSEVKRSLKRGERRAIQVDPSVEVC